MNIYSKKQSADLRRQKALGMLRMQLESGSKLDKATGEHIALTDQDKARMSKEIAILQERTK